MTDATNSSEPVQIRLQPTPNPNAWKFVLDRAVLNEGKATFNNAEEAFGNRLALDLLALDGVKQVHFFQNVITITGRLDCDARISRRKCKKSKRFWIGPFARVCRVMAATSSSCASNTTSFMFITKERVELVPAQRRAR